MNNSFVNNLALILTQLLKHIRNRFWLQIILVPHVSNFFQHYCLIQQRFLRHLRNLRWPTHNQSIIIKKPTFWTILGNWRTIIIWLKIYHHQIILCIWASWNAKITSTMHHINAKWNIVSHILLYKSPYINCSKRLLTPMPNPPRICLSYHHRHWKVILKLIEKIYIYVAIQPNHLIFKNVLWIQILIKIGRKERARYTISF